MFLDDEKKLSYKDIKWLKENIPESGTDTDGSLNEKPAEPLENLPAADPYEDFLKGQRWREATWSAERAAKQAKVNSSPVETLQRGTSEKTVELDKVEKTENLQRPATQISENDEVGRLKRQLEEKNQALETGKKVWEITGIQPTGSGQTSPRGFL